MNSPNASRLAIGTAQFGLPYGVANRTGQVSPRAAADILAHARQAGIDTLDTAVGYGDSEATLGQAGTKSWRIITKLPPVPDDCADVGAWADDQIESSLQRLQIDRLDGCLLHQPAQLLDARIGPELDRALTRLKARGRAVKTGISVYNPKELDVLWPASTNIDLVQVPFNPFDQSLVNSGWLAELADSGVEIHTRSVFLQGLLLMEPEALPEKFSRWQACWDNWDNWLNTANTDALSACIQFALSRPEIDRVVVGVDSLAQLQEIIAAASSDSGLVAPDSLQCEDPLLINPANWDRL